MVARLANLQQSPNGMRSVILAGFGRVLPVAEPCEMEAVESIASHGDVAGFPVPAVRRFFIYGKNGRMGLVLDKKNRAL